MLKLIKEDKQDRLLKKFDSSPVKIFYQWNGKRFYSSNLDKWIQKRESKSSCSVRSFVRVLNYSLFGSMKKITRSQKAMEAIEIDFNHAQIGFHFGKHLGEIIKSLRSTKKLSLKFDSLVLDDNGLDSIGKSIKSLKDLQQIDLHFKNLKITEKGRKNLGHFLAALNKLVHVTLNFSFCHDLLDSSVLSLIHPLKSWKTLQNLTLNFSTCQKVTDLSCTNLSQRLQSLNNLKSLSLSFSGKHVTNQGFETLLSAIDTLPKLEKLSLDFSNSEVAKNIPVASLAKTLQSLKFLRTLRLELPCAGGKLNDDGLIELSHGLKFLDLLETLSLTFSSKEIKDGGFQSLCKTIGTLPSLQNLSLVLVSHTMTEVGWATLGQILPTLNNIRSFSLIAYDQFTKQTFESLGQGLENMQALRKVFIHLPDCTIENEEIENLEKRLKSMKHIVEATVMGIES